MSVLLILRTLQGNNTSLCLPTFKSTNLYKLYDNPYRKANESKTSMHKKGAEAPLILTQSHTNR